MKAISYSLDLLLDPETVCFLDCESYCQACSIGPDPTQVPRGAVSTVPALTPVHAVTTLGLHHMLFGLFQRIDATRQRCTCPQRAASCADPLLRSVLCE